MSSKEKTQPASTGLGSGKHLKLIDGSNGQGSRSAVLPGCVCRANPSGCLICRRWNRLILRLEARRVAMGGF